ncbi:MAG: hypothetical protein NC127_03185, partial [Muribaculum sp.]|nr:hypothetical protein [Muribaculum sp.]
CKFNTSYAISCTIHSACAEITLANNAIEMPMLALAEHSFDDTFIGNNTEWTVSIFNAITNQNMFSCNTSDSVIVDTSNWP